MKEITWHTETRKVSDLIPMENNPRQANEKEYKDLDQSLKKFNVADPIIINTNNKVIGGHFRLKILKDKGIKEVDVRVPGRKLTDDEEKELALRLNKNTGSWDYDLLANFDEDILKDVGFESGELLNIFNINENEEFEKREIELKPYNKIHFLISVDLSDSRIAKITAFVEKLQEQGIEVEISSN